MGLQHLSHARPSSPEALHAFLLLQCCSAVFCAATLAPGGSEDGSYKFRTVFVGVFSPFPSAFAPAAEAPEEG